MVVAITH